MAVKIPKRGDIPPPTFKNFITELASTALVCLGYLQSPVAGRKTLDIPRAEHLIQMLEMLAVKTHGNLNAEEQEYLDTVIQDLRAKLADRRDEAGKAG